MAITPLQDYEKACNRLKAAFIKSLYPDKEDCQRILDEGEGWWIGGEIGGVFGWWDYFINANNMADYFRYGYAPDEFFDWHDQYIENSVFRSNKKNQKPVLNMKAFKRATLTAAMMNEGADWIDFKDDE